MSGSQPLLVVERLTIDPERATELDAADATRVAHLVDLPGHRWASRYVDILDPAGRLVLWSVDHLDAHEEIAGSSVEATDRAVTAYRQIDGTPFDLALAQRNHLFALAGAHPAPGREDEFNTWYSGRHVPRVVELPGYLSGARYRRVDDGTLGSPLAYLASYELEGEEMLPTMFDPDLMTEEAKVERENALTEGVSLSEGEMTWNMYRHRSRHWPLA